MKIIIIFLIPFLLSICVNAATQEEISEFDKILTPLTKFYEFIKYSSILISSLYLVFCGIEYITSSQDAMKKSFIKLKIAYILLGLAIIWAAPYLVSLILK